MIIRIDKKTFLSQYATPLISIIRQYKDLLICPNFPQNLINKETITFPLRKWFILVKNNKIQAVASFINNFHEILLSVEKNFLSSSFHLFIIKEMYMKYNSLVGEVYSGNPMLKTLLSLSKKQQPIWIQYKHINTINKPFSYLLKLKPIFEKYNIDFDGFCLYIPYEYQEILNKFPLHWSEVAFYSEKNISNSFKNIVIDFDIEKISRYNKAIKKFEKIIVSSNNTHIITYYPQELYFL